MTVKLLFPVFVVSLVTALRIPPPPDLPKPDRCGLCAPWNCFPIMSCQGGYIGKDSCNCCNVCIKTEELSRCGGSLNVLGLCGNDMFCHVRHPNSHENRGLMPDSKIGRCEKAACKSTKCGKHQWCVIKNGQPECVCHFNCHEDRDSPVCGLTNGKQYRNRCLVRKEECKLQKEIGIVSGTCKTCSFSNREYKYGEVVNGDDKCEVCTCKHGNWICSLNLDCLKEKVYKGYECTGYTNLHDRIACQEGYKCKFTKISEGIGSIPSLGFCEALDPQKTCGLPRQPGTCFGYFESWFYDARRGKCVQFVYGGCGGNDNRFDTLGECQRFCGNYTGTIAKPEVPDGSSVPKVPVIPTTPKVPVVPKKPVEPKVPVVPIKPVVPKVPVVPKKPVVPKVPVVPKKPVVPKVPVVPKKPVVPKVPDVPKKPVISKVPVVPKKPVVPKVPDVPKKPVISKVPVVPKKPVISKIPVAPKKPVVPKVPDVPKKPVISKVPVVSKKPVISRVPVVPKKPVVPKVPVVPKKPVVPKVPDVAKKPVEPRKPVLPKRSKDPKAPILPKTPDSQIANGSSSISNIKIPKKPDVEISPDAPGSPFYEIRQAAPEPKMRVVEAGAPFCGLPPETGDCRALLDKWYYDAKEKKCRLFQYGGCNGNLNNFDTAESCERLCGGYSGPYIEADVSKVPKPDKTKPPVGPVKPALPDKEPSPPIPDNGKPPKGQVKPDVPDKRPTPPISEKAEPGVEPLKPGVPEKPLGGKDEFCHFGDKKYKVGEQYVSQDCTGMCTCHGAKGHSCVSLCPPSFVICKSYEKEIEEKSEPFPGTNCSCNIPKCVPVVDTCGLPPESGSCYAHFTNWHYNAKKKKCVEFVYGGCGGNGNNFETLERCQSSCGNYTGPYIEPLVPEIPFLRKKDLKNPVKPFKPSIPGALKDGSWLTVNDKDEGPKRKPKYGDDDIHIHGKVSFKKSPGKLPPQSCLRVVFEDVSLQDEASVVYENKEFNVSSADMNTHYEYKFKTKKPKDIHEFYAISAVLNVGWCPDPDSDDWVRDFDFLSDTTIFVPISENTTDYEVNVPVVFHCRGTKCPEENSKEEKSKEEEPIPLPIKKKLKEKSIGADMVMPPAPIKEPEEETDVVLPPEDIEGGEEGSFFSKFSDIKREPEYDDEAPLMIIRGKIHFSKKPGKLPPNSCLHVAFKDTAIADLPSVLYKEIVVDLSDVLVDKNYTYKLKTKKPKRIHASYTVSATLNVGWCSKTSSSKWIREKDYLTDTKFHVDLEESKGDYERDLTMIWHCTSDCGEGKGAADHKPKARVKEDEKLAPNGEKENRSKGGRIFSPQEPGKVEDGSKRVLDAEVEKSRQQDAQPVKMHDMKTHTLKSIEKMETETKVPYSHNRKPVVGNESITITGNVDFDKTPGKLPSPSCLNIFFEDVSFQDVESVLYEKKQIDVSGLDMKKQYKYSLETKKPVDMKLDFSISAVLNIGWCPSENSSSWLRNYDFLSKANVKVPIQPEENLYTRDIIAVYYCRGSTCKNVKKEAKPDSGKNFPSIGQIKIPKPIQQRDDSASKNKEKKKPEPVIPRKPLPRVPQEKKCIDYEKNKTYNVGDEWFGEDDCMHCTCIRDGYPVCSTPMCALPFCTTGEAMKIKGRCCPVCPEDHICMSRNGRARVAYKERWQEDDCHVCECTKSGTVCVDPSKVSQRCKFPQRWNGKCKPVCIDDIVPPKKVEEPKGCIKPDGSSATFGTTWKTSCSTCECSSINGYICKGPKCEYSEWNCEQLVKLPGECCPRCKAKKCRNGFLYHLQGEKILTEDELAICECNNGTWKCDTTSKKDLKEAFEP